MDGLFALGSNASGQLGLGHKEDVSVPKQVQFACEVPKNDMITKVAAGGNHTILLTESGRAYWSGDSSTNSCGIVSDSDRDSARFRELVLSRSDSSPSRVAHAACTWDSSVLVLEDAHAKATRVYICGFSENHNVPRPGTDVASKGEPHLLVDFPPPGREVRDVAAGFKHVVIVLDNGDVYGWGNGRKGQLGRVDRGDDLICQYPRKINDVNFKVAKAVCCQYTTCLIAEPGDGRILVLGADKWGLQSEAPIEVPSWKMISASWGGIYILKRDGSLIAWGRDDHGQLPPPTVPAISSIAAGSEHVLVLTENGDVLAWGWGEHGNCGPQTEKSGDVKGRWNVLASLKNLPEGTQITTIGAGCATSWIHIVADGIFL